MMPDAEVAGDPECPKPPLGTIDLLQAFWRYWGAVGNPRRQAWSRRLRPCRQSARARKFANLCLGEPCQGQRRLDAMLRGRPRARTMTRKVIGIGPVDDGRHPLVAGHGTQHGPEHTLAEIAAIYGICGVARIV